MLLGYVHRDMGIEQGSMSVGYFKGVCPRVCRRENVRGVFPGRMSKEVGIMSKAVVCMSWFYFQWGKCMSKMVNGMFTGVC